MTLAFILSTIARKIQDSSYSNEDILGIINMGIGEIASVETLPDLIVKETVTVQAGEHSTFRPDDYHSKLFSAYNTTKKHSVTVHKKLTEFLEAFPDFTVVGDVTDLVLSGEEILVRHTPASDQDIVVWYVKKPEMIETTTSELPDYLPTYLQAPLFINYACRYIYSEIEDGTQRSQPNFEKYDGLYMEARAALRTYLGLPEGNPEFIASTESTAEEEV